MLTQKRISKKKITIYLVLIIIILAAIGYIIYRTFFMTSGKIEEPVISSTIILPSKVETSFKEEIFDSFLFRNLEIHGDLPVKVKEQGKTNPFESFTINNY